MGSARALWYEWLRREGTDRHCPGLPLEMLAALRNFSTETSGHVGKAEGDGLLPQDICTPGVLGKAACPILGYGELLLHNWSCISVPAAL